MPAIGLAAGSFPVPGPLDPAAESRDDSAV